MWSHGLPRGSMQNEEEGGEEEGEGEWRGKTLNTIWGSIPHFKAMKMEIWKPKGSQTSQPGLSGPIVEAWGPLSYSSYKTCCRKGSF